MRAPDAVLTAVKDNPPRCFPTVQPMDTASRLRHSHHGRRFEVSLLSFHIEHCNCCGRTVPENRDPATKANKGTGFRHSHLTGRFHPAWRCACPTVCHGEQFYAAARPKQMQYFASQHSGQTPSLALSLELPNATLCDFCYRDLTGKHGETVCFSATTCSCCFTCAAYCALIVLILPLSLSLFLS
jgi:hypothetical protein